MAIADLYFLFKRLLRLDNEPEKRKTQPAATKATVKLEEVKADKPAKVKSKADKKKD